MDETEFHEWVIENAKNIPSREMTEDDFFCKRVLKDVLYGRSKSFNKDSRKKRGEAGGLEFLREEFNKQRGCSSGTIDLL